jgi:hypothetical protein
MKPAVEQNAAYQAAYDHLNQELFKGVLTTPMLIFSQNRHVKRGMFRAQKWEQDETGDKVHEISIGINKMAERDIVGVFIVLLEQMIHQLQFEGSAGQFCKDGRVNRQWLDLAESIGLEPKQCLPGTYGVECALKPGGLAEQAITSIPRDALFPWMNLFESDAKPAWTGGKRTKYVCPECGNAVWGRRNLKIYCRGTQTKVHDDAQIENCEMEVA